MMRATKLMFCAMGVAIAVTATTFAAAASPVETHGSTSLSPMLMNVQPEPVGAHVTSKNHAGNIGVQMALNPQPLPPERFEW